MLGRLGHALSHRAQARLAQRRVRVPRLHDYEPVSMLRQDGTQVLRSRVPAIDVHNHLGRWLTGGRGWMAPDVGALIAQLDELGVETVVNLDGRWGDELEANLARYDRAHPSRFLTFCHLDWSLISRDDDAPTAWVQSLRRSAAAGAGGLKVWKDLGLQVRDRRGALLMPDDARLREVWDAAGELGLTVLMHVADPLAFFAPVDRHNERLEELLLHPDWSWHGRGLPDHPDLLSSFAAMLARHRATSFIGAHVASSAEDLAAVSSLLDAHPNLAVDLSAREAELGRQPRAVAALVERHPERLIWGTDCFPVDAARYRTWFRLLETADEHFAYSPERVPPQGRWAVSGLALPDDLLARVYRANAISWIPALSRPANGIPLTAHSNST